MTRSVLFAGLILTTISVGVSNSLVAAVANVEPSRDSLTFTLSAEKSFSVPEGPKEGRFEAFAELGLEKATGRTIPTFTRKILACGKMFQYTMVGADPFTRKARNTVVSLQIIPVRFQFDDGSVFDPTQPSLACEGGGKT